MRLPWLFAALAATGLAGCQKDLLANLPDAAIDASPDAIARTDCPLPALPLAPGQFKIYLNTDGVTLTNGSCNDSATNCSSLVTTSPVTVPPFLPGSATRQAYIDQIVAAVQQSLAPYSVDIVTARPTTGIYEMAVLGGSPAIAGEAAGTNSVSTFDCAIHRNAIDLIFDLGDPSDFVDGYASSILSDFGTVVGLVPSALFNDCECRDDAPCNVGTTALCTFGSAAPTTAVNSNCGITPIEDEPAILRQNLGCR